MRIHSKSRWRGGYRWVETAASPHSVSLLRRMLRLKGARRLKMKPLRSVLYLLVVLVVGILPRPAHALELPLPVRVTFEIEDAAGCGEGTLQQNISLRLGRPLRTGSRESTRVHIVIERVNTVIRASATFEGASGRDRRSVTGTSCPEAIAALSVIVATWIEIETTLSVPPSGERRAGDTPPPAPNPAQPETPTPPQREQLPGASMPTQARLLLGGHASLATGILGRPIAGAQVGLTWRAMGWFELRGLMLGQIGAESNAGGNVDFRAVSAMLDGCVRASLLRPLSLGACARLSFGLMHVQYKETTLPLLPIANAGPGLHLRWDLGSIMLETEVFLAAQALGYGVAGNQAKTNHFSSSSAFFGAGFVIPL
jgi:hypothetical protein